VLVCQAQKLILAKEKILFALQGPTSQKSEDVYGQNHKLFTIDCKFLFFFQNRDTDCSEISVIHVSCDSAVQCYSETLQFLGAKV
jgi:hypothetical protein